MDNDENNKNKVGIGNKDIREITGAEWMKILPYLFLGILGIAVIVVAVIVVVVPSFVNYMSDNDIPLINPFSICLLISLMFFNLILSGSVKTLKIAGILLIVGSVLKGMDLFQTYPLEAEQMLYWLPQNLSDFEGLVKVESYSDMAKTLAPQFDDDFIRRWQSSVPYLAHDALDGAFSNSFLGFIAGCLCIKFAQIQEQIQQKNT